ncbi:MAG: hypothetical protein IPH03_03770 [Tetrasphaera sp.]|nr:hypothetical protein [Tetrasphaera sp.]
MAFSPRKTELVLNLNTALEEAAFGAGLARTVAVPRVSISRPSTTWTDGAEDLIRASVALATRTERGRAAGDGR